VAASPAGAVFGFKNHVSIVRAHGFRRFTVAYAASSDGGHSRACSRTTTPRVWADTAYRSKRKRLLFEVHFRRKPGVDLSPRQTKANAAPSRTRSAATVEIGLANLTTKHEPPRLDRAAERPGRASGVPILSPGTPLPLCVLSATATAALLNTLRSPKGGSSRCPNGSRSGPTLRSGAASWRSSSMARRKSTPSFSISPDPRVPRALADVRLFAGRERPLRRRPTALSLRPLGRHSAQ
jgi:hypothetical protein